MQCANGFGALGRFIPMAYIKEMACESFYDLVRRKEGQRFISYQREVCQLAMKHIGNTFSEFEDEFCRTAPLEVRETAALMEATFKRTFLNAAFVFFVAGIVMNEGGIYARELGWAKTAKAINIVALGLGIGFMSYVFAYAIS